MQVTETLAEGLKHAFKITIPADQIEGKVNARLDEVGHNIQLPGFRPGKVPPALVRKKYGASVAAEIMEQLINESAGQVMEERKLRPATQPKIDVVPPTDGKDLEFSISFEAMPDIEPIDFAKLELVRMKAEVGDAQLDEALNELASKRSVSKAVDKPRKAETGDVVVIDFVGSIDGVEFDGGKGEDYELELGSGSFIPGFEEQLVGTKPPATVDVKVSFPEDYGHKPLAGKAALFVVTVKEIKEKVPATVDEDFAKSFGLEGLDALKTEMRRRMEGEYSNMSRLHLKRALLDVLSEKHSFPLPEALVDDEFGNIWKQIEEAIKNDTLEEADKGKSEDVLKSEYRVIAERRIRLGLLLAEVGGKNNIQVNQDDLNRAMVDRASRFPGQEHLVFQYYRNNPQALDSLRAPIFEEKTVDFIIELAKVSDKMVSVEELMKDPDAAPAGEAKPKAKAKKAKAEAEEKPEAEAEAKPKKATRKKAEKAEE
jgi:trigger factor